MSKPTDIRIKAAELFLLPVKTRVPLKFGHETLTSVVCARACVTVTDSQGRSAAGWGETPLSVQWVWPSSLSYEERLGALEDFCKHITKAYVESAITGHPLEIGNNFIINALPRLLDSINKDKPAHESRIPTLAALVCTSPFDLAAHDAFGRIHEKPVYATYGADFLSADLSEFLVPAEDTDISFKDRYPEDFLRIQDAPKQLKAWHLVGGLDPLTQKDLHGNEPNDEHPVLLPDWVQRDGLKCLKIKLRGNDKDWDTNRIVSVGKLAIIMDVDWLTVDFNCTVTEPEYVNEILDYIRDTYPRIYGAILYVEQPFPYDLERYRIDVHSLSARKPLFLDESAHDWKIVGLGRRLGWTGVALKTCKTQTMAILTACWAKAHGMSLMVQDLTNPMLAQIPHVLLAAHTDTIMGVETNCMQFYPGASAPEAAVHPGLFTRRNGKIDLSTIQGNGFGYRLDEIKRTLPEPVAGFET
ncbi:MAG: hypothetical protein K9N52_04730 [Verrucomicrobia bacterium]|nr:hypothetical protein [Verrucomicrobiota bacterium]